MKLIARPAVAALLLLITLTATSIAQQKRQTPARPKPAAAPAPPPTFDTLVPADSYSIYGEVRGIGQLARSNALNDALEPILKIAGPPKEFKRVVKWLNEHADELMTSRLLVAAWATAKGVPEGIVAIEFASAEEAAKFASPLNTMLTSVLPPVAEPAPESQGESPKPAAPPRPVFYLKQAGSLILLTSRPLTLKTLKPAGSKPLTDDVNFRAARNRFSSEPIFVFVNVKLMERQEEERRKQYEESQRAEAEQVKKRQSLPTEEAKKAEEPEVPEPLSDTGFVAPEIVKDNTGVGPVAIVKEAPAPDPVMAALSTIGSSFVDGTSKWPDGIAFALAFENDSFDLKALFVNEPGEKSDTVPFLPNLIPGPPVVPESPNILPADTELFATMSLDLPQIYTAMSRPRPNPMIYASRRNLQTVNEVAHASPFEAIEKKLKINLRDDLLPLLGSEIALRLPLTNLNLVGLPKDPAQPPDNKENPSPAGASPALLISLKDKEGVRALMPKIVDALGIKGASAFAQTERKEDTEIVSYLNLFSYAFVENFLVLSGDPATIRHIVDSYLKHETLASDINFKNSTRWQPRLAHGQLYVSGGLMESYQAWAEKSQAISDQARTMLTSLSPMIQPITYSLSNEGLGPLHEVHIPKNLVLMLLTFISGEANPTPERRHEASAMGLMFAIAHSQMEYKKDKGAGSYGTLEELIAAQLVSKETIENSGYKFDMLVTGDKFEVFAVPAEYGKTGKTSYFIDQTLVLRGADHNGASASSSDRPVF